MRKTSKAAAAGSAALVLVGVLAGSAGAAGAADGGDGLGPDVCVLEPSTVMPEDLSGDGRYGINGGQAGQALTRVEVATQDRVEIAPGSQLPDASSAIDGDGDRVVFVSDLDLSGDNPEGESEVFLADLDADTVQQLTDLEDNHLADVQISADGTRVAFRAGGADDVHDDENPYYRAYALSVGSAAELVSAEGERVDSLDLATGGDHLVYSTEGSRPQDPPFTPATLVGLVDGSRRAVPDTEVREPQVSADGGVVAWVGRPEDGSGWRAIVRWDTTADVRDELIATVPSGPTNPTVVELSDDGASLLFVGPNSTMIRFDADGSTAIMSSGSYGRHFKYGVGIIVASDDMREVRYTTVVGPTTRTDRDAGPEYRAVRARCGAESFSDDESTSATWARWSGLSTGYDDGTFRGGTPISRQAMAAMLHRFAGSPDLPSSAGFPDVGAGNPFRQEIGWARQEGLMYGYPDGTFRPVNPVSNQALASLAYRAAGEPDVSGSIASVVDRLIDVGPSNDHVEGITWWATRLPNPQYFRVNGTEFRPLEAASRSRTAWGLYQVAFIADR